MKEINNKILVSIVLTTFKRPVQLKKAILSVFSQTFIKYELIVVDDSGDKEFYAVNFLPHRLPFGDMTAYFNKIKRRILKIPNVVKYSRAIKIFNHSLNNEDYIIPTIIPNWDHTPRSGANVIVLHKSTPKLFKNHIKNILNSIKKRR